MTGKQFLSPAEAMGLTGWEQARRIGLTRRQFDYWCINGWVYAGQEDVARPGSGEPRRPLTDDEMLHLHLMQSFVGEGLKPERASLLASQVIAYGSVSFGAATIQWPATPRR